MEINKQELLKILQKYHSDVRDQLIAADKCRTHILTFQPDPSYIPEKFIKELIEVHCSQLFRARHLFDCCEKCRLLNLDSEILTLIDETENMGLQLQHVVSEIFTIFKTHFHHTLEDMAKDNPKILGYEYFTKDLMAVKFH